MKPGTLSSPQIVTCLLVTLILASSWAHADTPSLVFPGLRVPSKPNQSWTGTRSSLMSRSRTPSSAGPSTATRRSQVRPAAWTTQSSVNEPYLNPGEVMEQGEYYEDIAPGEITGHMRGDMRSNMPMGGGCDQSGCNPGCSIGCGCQGTLDPNCLPSNPICWVDWRRAEFFAGVQAFKGPTSSPSTQSDSGSFGFHEGFNFGRPLHLIGCGELGWQLGGRAIQANLSGSDFTNDTRHQIFATGGIFRRIDYGWQWGVVADYLNDKWYYDDINLLQVRGELAYKLSPNNEYGFRFMLSTHDSSVVGEINDGAGGIISLYDTFTATDQYRFFHRRTLHGGTQVEINGGFSGHSDGLVGAQATIPISECFSLQTNASYLVPGDGRYHGGNRWETWNLGMSLVWHPCGRVCQGRDYYRPLLNVADNGSMMVIRK